MYVGDTVRSVNTFGDCPAFNASTIAATLPFDFDACASGPNSVSTRRTYPRGASVANHSPRRFEVPYTLRGFVGSVSRYGTDADPSNTKSVLKWTNIAPRRAAACAST